MTETKIELTESPNPQATFEEFDAALAKVTGAAEGLKQEAMIIEAFCKQNTSPEDAEQINEAKKNITAINQMLDAELPALLEGMQVQKNIVNDTLVKFNKQIEEMATKKTELEKEIADLEALLLEVLEVLDPKDPEQNALYEKLNKQLEKAKSHLTQLDNDLRVLRASYAEGINGIQDVSRSINNFIKPAAPLEQQNQQPTAAELNIRSLKLKGECRGFLDQIKVMLTKLKQTIEPWVNVASQRMIKNNINLTETSTQIKSVQDAKAEAQLFLQQKNLRQTSANPK